MPVQVDLRQDHGFLGIYYQFHDGYADVISVVPNTPAEQIGIRPGDHVLTIDHNRSRSGIEFQQRIFNSHSGASPELVVERRGDRMPTLRPTLAAWPSLISNAH